MKHTFKKVVVLALTVIMCLSTIMPSAMAATTTCPGKNATHTAYNCTYTEGTVSAATCEAAGSVLGVCTGCGDNFILKTVEATGHDWEISAASCDTASYRTCKTCKKVELVKAAAGHAWGDWEVSGECRVGEKRTQTCTVCGATNVDIMTEDHAWIVGEFVAPERCGLAGHVVYVCANKGCDVKRTEDVWLGDGATSHNWVTWATALSNNLVEGEDLARVEATCTVAGVETKVCAVCGLQKVVNNGKNTSHSAADIGKRLQFVDGVFEDCCVNWKGRHGYWKCYDCGLLYKAVSVGSTDIKEVGSDGKEYWKTTEYTYSKTEIGAKVVDGNGNHTTNVSYVPEINNKGHHHWLGAYQAATCTTAGYSNRYCAMCGTKEEKTMAALGHLFAPDVPSGDRTKIIEFVYKKVEGASSYSASSNHDWDAFVRLNPDIKTAVTAATCTTDGKYEWLCLRDGCFKTANVGKKEVIIPATGHNFSTTVTVTGTIPATCTTPGVNKYKCNNSGCTVTNDVIVAALGHKIKTTTVAATCLNEGSTTEYCERKATCGLEDVVTVLKKDPANHAWIEVGTPTTPTCTDPGKGTHYCQNCAISPTAYEIPALGHKYLEGDDLAEAIKALTTVGQTFKKDGKDVVKYLTAGDCTKDAYYQLTCVNGTCQMFTYHKVTEGFNVGGHDVVVVYRNPAREDMGTNAATPAYSGIVKDIYNKYGKITVAFTNIHSGTYAGTDSYGQVAAVGHSTDINNIVTGKNYFWYCKNAGCPMARTSDNPTFATEIIAEGNGHFVKDNDQYRLVTLTDVPDERISKVTFDKAKDVKAPVDENGNITAIAIDIPGTTLVWRYKVDACCEYDEVKEGGFWCVECQKPYEETNQGCNVENAAKRGHTLDSGTKVNADCQSYGFVRYACTACEYAYVTNYVAPVDHNYAVLQDVKATCLMDGYQLLKCRTCEETTVIVPEDDAVNGVYYHAVGHKNINGQFLSESCLAVVAGKDNTATNRFCVYCATAIISDHVYDAANVCIHCGRAKKN